MPQHNGLLLRLLPRVVILDDCVLSRTLTYPVALGAVAGPQNIFEHNMDVLGVNMTLPNPCLFRTHARRSEPRESTGGERSGSVGLPSFSSNPSADDTGEPPLPPGELALMSCLRW